MPEPPGHLAVSGVYYGMEGSLTLVFASDYNSRSCNHPYFAVLQGIGREEG
jgi:hypothetical protein